MPGVLQLHWQHSVVPIALLQVYQRSFRVWQYCKPYFHHCDLRAILYTWVGDWLQLVAYKLLTYLASCLKQYKIGGGRTRLPIVVTTDRGSNIASAILNRAVNLAWVPCFSHVLNRGINVVFKTVRKGSSMGKLVNLAKYMNKSPVVAAAWKQYQVRGCGSNSC